MRILAVDDESMHLILPAIRYSRNEYMPGLKENQAALRLIHFRLDVETFSKRRPGICSLEPTACYKNSATNTLRDARPGAPDVKTVGRCHSARGSKR